MGVRQVLPVIGEKHIWQNDKIQSTNGVIMPATVEGKMVDGRTIVLDHPLATGQQEVLMQKKKRAGSVAVKLVTAVSVCKKKPAFIWCTSTLRLYAFWIVCRIYHSQSFASFTELSRVI